MYNLSSCDQMFLNLSCEKILDINQHGSSAKHVFSAGLLQAAAWILVLLQVSVAVIGHICECVEHCTAGMLTVIV